MNRQKTLCIALSILGLGLFGAGLLLWEAALPRSVSRTLLSAGGCFASLGVTRLLVLRMDQKDPARVRSMKIENTDERNVAIRRRAKALSGEVLQWTVLALAWVALGLDALWVAGAALAIVVGKSLLEAYLVARYQREM